MRTVSVINKELSELYKEREKALEEENKKYIGKYYKYPNDKRYAHISGILGENFTLLIVDEDSILITGERIRDCLVIHWVEVTREEFEKQFDLTAITIKGGMK